MPMNPASLMGVSTMRSSPHFSQRPSGHFVGTVVLSDFFTHDDDHRVAGEFLIEGFTEGVTIGELAGHGKEKRNRGERGKGDGG
jgi:hypothetical protein